MGYTTMALGAGMKAGGDVKQGKTKSSLLDANAIIADEQAKSEVAAGSYNANLVRTRGQKIQGQQVAAIGANNLTQGGTNADVVAQSARQNEMDALQTTNNALRRAWGFQVQASSDRFQSSAVEKAGMMSGIGDLVSAGGQAYAMSG